jgi:hypothetical protein
MQDRRARSWRRGAFVALVSALTLASAAAAQSEAEVVAAEDDAPAVASSTSGAYTHSAPVARAVRLNQSVTVDGRLDDAGWGAAPVISGFTQLDPFEGQPVSQRTEVRIVFDDDALYVGAMLYDTEAVSTGLARRDASVPSSDNFEIVFDSYHDHQTASRFGVNPSGVKQDGVVSGSGGGDTTWDPVWDAATSITPEGWSVEMRIPFSQLRFSRAEQQVWGIQMERSIHHSQELAVFAFTPKLERGGVPRYGHLEGISDLKASRRLELLPYVAARAEYREIPGDSRVSFTNPFRSGSDYFGHFGGDLKYGITSNLTLDATVQPDFGQVEVDPAVINLTAFETRFEERRPFFIEGAEIFRFAEGGPGGSTGRPPQLLYSRRIGRSPQGNLPPGAVFSEVPTDTRILGAAKLTGKTLNGWSVGLLEAVTGRETANYVDITGERREAVVEPLTNYSVGRLRRDFRDGQSRVGVIGTMMQRRLDDPALQNRLRSAAYTGGIDFIQEWNNRSWRVLGAFAPAYVMGTQEVITQTQMSSSRYFQRPDASYLRVDSTATSLAGYYAMIDFNRYAGPFQWKLAFSFSSPSYEANDAGFQTAADRIVMDTNVQYTQTRPGTILRRWNIRGNYLPDGMWNYGGNRVFTQYNVQADITFMNYWGGSARLEFDPETDNDRLTRGGPLSRDPRRYGGSFNVSSDSRKDYTGRLAVNAATDEGGSWSHGLDLNLSYRPGATMDFRVTPSIERSYTAAQFVTSVEDALATQTFGRRYVFGGLHQTTFGVDTRANVTFTPDLSFQLYMQPFFSTGRYGAMKELSAPRVFEFLEYGEDIGTRIRDENGRFQIDPDGDPATANHFAVSDPDFNLLSLRGNAVLRWEYRPGSTFYLVWQQSRSERLLGRDALPDDRVGHFDLSRDIRELLDVKPANVLVFKVNYWLNP